MGARTGPNSTGFSINSERTTCWWCRNSNRLSRSLRDVLTIMERLGEAGVGFRSLTEAIDTTTPRGSNDDSDGRAFAEFEESMLKERSGIRCYSPGRPDWWSASKAFASAAGRDPKDGVQRQKNRR